MYRAFEAAKVIVHSDHHRLSDVANVYLTGGSPAKTRQYGMKVGRPKLGKH